MVRREIGRRDRGKRKGSVIEVKLRRHRGSEKGVGYIGVGGRSNHGVVTKYNAKERYLRYSYKNNEKDGIDARCATSQRPS